MLVRAAAAPRAGRCWAAASPPPAGAGAGAAAAAAPRRSRAALPAARAELRRAASPACPACAAERPVRCCGYRCRRLDSASWPSRSLTRSLAPASPAVAGARRIAGSRHRCRRLSASPGANVRWAPPHCRRRCARHPSGDELRPWPLSDSGRRCRRRPGTRSTAPRRRILMLPPNARGSRGTGRSWSDRRSPGVSACRLRAILVSVSPWPPRWCPERRRPMAPWRGRFGHRGRAGGRCRGGMPCRSAPELGAAGGADPLAADCAHGVAVGDGVEGLVSGTALRLQWGR